MTSLWKYLFGISADDFAGIERWSLRFTGLPENLWWLFALVGLFAVLVALTVRSYRREGKWPLRLKLAIAALRLCVFALLIAVILQPALILRFAREQSSAVLLLLDDTASMQWRDRHGDPAERSALAGLVGIPEQALDGEERPTRSELVRRVLARPTGLLEQLTRDHPVELYRFGVTAKDSSDYLASVMRLEQRRRPAEAVGGTSAFAADLEAKLAALTGAGHTTDPARALREVLDRHEGRPVAAVVVVSDGQCTDAARSRDRQAAAREVATQRAIAVFAVSVGDPAPPRNLAVRQLDGPREARVGSMLTFTAFVAAQAMAATSVEIRLSRSASADGPWEDSGAAATVTVGGAAATTAEPGQAEERLAEVPIAVKAADTGTFVYRARIEPVPGEMLLRDNEAVATVRLTDRKTEILLVSGDANWGFQFLRDFLLRQHKDYAVSVWQQNADARFNQEASLGMKRSALPKTRDELMRYDAVILCDPRFVPDSLDPAFAELLEDYVAKRCGGLCYIAGRKNTERNLLEGGPLAALAGLLPVVLAPTLEQATAQEVIPLTLTAEGRDMPLLRLADDAAASDAIWDRLPGFYWAQHSARAKPLARVLAVRARPGDTAADDGEPLMAVQYYGKGRVLYLGLDGMWRWRRLDEAAHFRRFWTNVLGFLSAGRLENKRIVVNTASETYDAGSAIEVRVEAANRDHGPLDSEALTLSLRPLGGGEARTQVLRRERPGLFRGTVMAERTGSFELVVPCDGAGQTDWADDDVASRRITVRQPQAELRRPESDPLALKVLAGEADRCVNLAAIDTLAQRIPLRRSTLVNEVPHTLWDTIFVLSLIGILLLTEWTLRKMFHMM